MAKKNEPVISAEDLKSASTVPSTGGFVMSASAFDDVDGEVYAGLNILKLKEGEAAGPLVLKEIKLRQQLGTDKSRKPVDVYIAAFNKTEMRMPVAASFVQKAKDAKLSIGEVFYLKRSEDYVAKKFGKAKCAAYELKVIRGKK